VSFVIWTGRSSGNANFRRNFGVLVAFTIFYLGTYIVAAELVSSKKSKGEILVFRRGHVLLPPTADVENPVGSKVDAAAEAPDIPSIEKHTSIFHWRDICFDITVNKENKRILDHVDGWIKPGTVTALLVRSTCEYYPWLSLW